VLKSVEGGLAEGLCVAVFLCEAVVFVERAHGTVSRYSGRADGLLLCTG